MPALYSTSSSAPAASPFVSLAPHSAGYSVACSVLSVFPSQPIRDNFIIPFNSSEVQITLTNPLNLNQATPSVFGELNSYTNMLRLDTVNSAGGDLNIYINDTDIQWSTGQTLRLAFNNALDTRFYAVMVINREMTDAEVLEMSNYFIDKFNLDV